MQTDVCPHQSIRPLASSVAWGVRRRRTLPFVSVPPLMMGRGGAWPRPRGRVGRDPSDKGMVRHLDGGVRRA